MTWSTNFDTKINATPTDYGLTVALADNYHGLHEAFILAYNTANDPLTRSPANIAAKNTAKEELIENARMLARIVQAAPGISAAQRESLGLTVPDVEPSPIPVPDAAPAIEIMSAVGRLVKIRLWDTENPDNRGKPAGVSGATVLTYIGAAPPAPEDIAAWKFETNISKTTTTVEFPPTVPSGATAWFTAFWFNPRKQSGPATLPVSAQIPASLPAAA